MNLSPLFTLLGQASRQNEADFDRYLEFMSPENAVIRCNMEYLERVKINL